MCTAHFQVPSRRTHVEESDASNVTVALNGVATLTGTKTVAAANGVASFTGLSMTKSGNYTLAITDGSLASATSGP